MTMDHPYREIPNLPILNEKLRTELTNFVKKELGAQLEQMEEIRRKMEELKERYSIEEIKAMVQHELEELQVRIEQLKDMDSISRVYSYTQMATNDLRRLEEKVYELYVQYQSETSDGDDRQVEVPISRFIQVMIPSGQVEIRTEDDVDRLLEKMKQELLKEIQNGKVVVIKK